MTVFVPGVNSVRWKRLYVSASRAKQRLFFIGDEEAFASNRTLPHMPAYLYTKLYHSQRDTVEEKASS